MSFVGRRRDRPSGSVAGQVSITQSADCVSLFIDVPANTDATILFPDSTFRKAITIKADRNNQNTIEVGSNTFQGPSMFPLNAGDIITIYNTSFNNILYRNPNSVDGIIYAIAGGG